MKKIKVPLPPKHLQDEFALYASDCDKLKFEVKEFIKNHSKNKQAK